MTVVESVKSTAYFLEMYFALTREIANGIKLWYKGDEEHTSTSNIRALLPGWHVSALFSGENEYAGNL
jgi:hypothetical protein